MIDTTQPLELTDGTPVTLVSASTCGNNISVNLPVGTSARLRIGGTDYGRLFGRTGNHLYGEKVLHLRNVTQATRLDPTKPLVTRSGLAVRYITTDRDRLVVEVTRYGGPALEFRNLDGSLLDRPSGYRGLAIESSDDVINKVTRRTAYYNVYSDGSTGTSVHLERDHAVERCKVGKARIGILKVVTVDGVFANSSYEALTAYTRPNGTTKGRAVAQTVTI